MTTRTITIRRVPDETLARLRERAEENRRSLNGELLELLDRAVTPARPIARVEPPSGAPRRAAARERAAASWTAAAGASDEADDVDGAELAAVCRRHHIRWLAVFGARARLEARPGGDIDVIVEFEPGRTPGFGIVRIAEALRPLFGGRQIDLHTPGGLAPGLSGPALDSARTLYGER
ncbi:MAG: Arc family DNA-binding protein [Gemmatimonadota bacterium]